VAVSGEDASRGVESIAVARLVERMLDVLEDDVLPLSQAGVGEGNKVFGAAVLRKADLGLVIAGTNEEATNPLFHGEISCLNRYWALPAESRPAPGECLFLSSHEPCSLCLSAITWSGFDNFYYLFSYEDTRDEFEIPHDLNILSEVFRCRDGEYAARNAYWSSFHLTRLAEEGDKARRAAAADKIEALRAAYGVLSDLYQADKGSQGIPLD
jgi:tRNA(Arg) A34 adenosine deaminase TadA